MNIILTVNPFTLPPSPLIPYLQVEKFYTETLMKEARSRFKLIKEQLQELELHREEYRDAYKSINTALLPILVALRHLKERILPESGEGAEQKKIFGSHYKYEPHRLGAADRKLELAICEFYVYLGSIKNYCAINKEGFDKCAHKIEQELSIKCIKRYKDKVHNTKFSHSYALSDLQARTVALYSEDFGGKDKKKAAHHLRALTRPVTAKSFATARAGVFLGIALVFGTFALLNGETCFSKLGFSWDTARQMVSDFVMACLLQPITQQLSAEYRSMPRVSLSCRRRRNIRYLYDFGHRSASDLRRLLPSRILGFDDWLQSDCMVASTRRYTGCLLIR